ncbi:unnamed protein product [Cuscuta epithymum]|uniref:Uncharacterized protein n=1 Tax=Cuscuta epithymum TaxID=186058 RepID=A0AAV0F780_9ASTE|nr:unnamed protein product [Cuscuta epithymum]
MNTREATHAIRKRRACLFRPPITLLWSSSFSPCSPSARSNLSIHPYISLGQHPFASGSPSALRRPLPFVEWIRCAVRVPDDQNGRFSKPMALTSSSSLGFSNLGSDSL